MPLVKIQRKGQMTLPTGVRNALGVADGDMVDVKISGRRIIITPTLIIDRSKFPTADDEYTPAQRRFIDARLAEGLADIKAGRTFGPFNTAEEMIADMKARLKKRATGKSKKRLR